MVRLWLVFCGLAWVEVFSSLCMGAKNAAVPLSAGHKQTLKPIHIVGSEVVFPYAAAVAERFAAATHQPIPILESVGTGGGIALFCRNGGDRGPDILMASRQLTTEDYHHCPQMGIAEDDLVEIPIGLDGIIFVQAKTALPLSLTRKQIFKALSAAEHPLPQTWKDVSSELPPTVLRILGPSGVSGTYESLLSLMLKPFCPKGAKAFCVQIRHDLGYTEMGANQNLLIEKLAHNPGLVGIVSFGFFMTNRARLQGIPIEGIEPTFKNLFERRYPFLRPIYVYVRKSRILKRPEILRYVESFSEKEAIDFWGYLVRKGLVPLSPQEQQDILKRLILLKGLLHAVKSF